MNIVSGKKSLQLNVPIVGEDIIEQKLSKFISALSIMILTCVIIITSALIFNHVQEMITSNNNTFTYVETIETEMEEEPTLLVIGF